MAFIRTFWDFWKINQNLSIFAEKLKPSPEPRKIMLFINKISYFPYIGCENEPYPKIFSKLFSWFFKFLKVKPIFENLQIISGSYLLRIIFPTQKKYPPNFWWTPPPKNPTLINEVWKVCDYGLTIRISNLTNKCMPYFSQVDGKLCGLKQQLENAF